MKKIICGITAATIATACCMSPILANASSTTDFESYLDVVEWVFTLTGSEAAVYSAGGSSALGGTVIGLEMAAYMLDNPTIGENELIHISADTFRGVTGLYQDSGGNYKLGFAVLPAGSVSAQDGGITIACGDDFTISATCSAGTTVQASRQTDDYSYVQYDLTFSGSSGGVLVRNSKNQDYLSGDAGLRYGNTTTFSCSLSPGVPSLYGTPLSTYFTGSYNAPPFIGQAISFTLPEGDMIPANPSYYIDNTVRPYVEENYPDYIYLLPEPQPEPPQYETEFVTGIPKSWTIINPQLPSIPDINIQLPTIDFPSLPDVSRIPGLQAGFWWSLFDEILTRSSLKWLYLAIPVICLAAFAVWKLGD